MKLLSSALTPGQAYFDEENHEYWAVTDNHTLGAVKDIGDQMVSGSQFASRYKPTFEREHILNASARKWDHSVEDIERTWTMKRDASLHYGNAVHQALELYGEGLKLDLGKEIICGLPHLAQVTKAFYTPERCLEECLHEEFICAPEKGACGLVDRVVIHSWEDRVCSVGDFKTNRDLWDDKGRLLEPFEKIKNSPLGGYTLQLNYYAEILECAGWVVQDLDIFWLTDNDWVTVPVPRVSVWSI